LFCELVNARLRNFISDLYLASLRRNHEALDQIASYLVLLCFGRANANGQRLKGI